MNNNKIGVTGYKGRLGSQLIKAGCTPLACDITSIDSVQAAIELVQPELVINCAAYTNVDGAETEQEKALKVNMWGVKNLFESFSGKIIHISTDYVFDGKKGKYKETSKPNPISFYGMTKWTGEQVCVAYGNCTIVRVSGLFGGNKPDFVSSILKGFSENEETRVPANLVGSYVYVPHLVEALLEISHRQAFNAFAVTQRIINIVNEGILSRYEFALAIAKVFGLDKGRIKPKQSYSGVAKRPKKAGLRVDLAKKLGLPIYSILDGLRDYEKSFPHIADL